MIHGLPFRLSISDCFSVTMISANMTSEYHNNFFASFLKNYLMPSWFHLIRIALNLLFFLFFCFFFAVCLLVDSNLQPSHPFAFFLFYYYYFIFLPIPLFIVSVQLLDAPSLNAFWTMSVLSRLTAASYWLCLQVCVTNKTLVSIDQLQFSLFSFTASNTLHVWALTFCSSNFTGVQFLWEEHFG